MRLPWNVIGNMFLFKYLSLTQKEAKEKGLFFYLIRSFFAIVVKIIGFPNLWKILKPFIHCIGQYDVAISYTQNLSLKSLYCGCPEFVIDKVKAHKKIAWIHADYQKAKIANEYNDSLYKHFDKVINVTERMKRKFDSLNVIPKEKSEFIYNRFNADQIQQKSRLYEVPYNQGLFNIVSVCRLEKEKGVDQLMMIAKCLHDKGLNFCWNFVGTGVLADWCKEFIEKSDLDNNVNLLGQKANPYPYIYNADLFVSGSLTETFGISILEALVLGVPTLAYRFEAIDEVLKDSNGLVADSFNDMQEEIEKLITDQSYYERLKARTHVLLDYNNLNSEQIEKILK